MLPLALVLVLLIGSVLIPAHQSWRILQLLRQTADVVEPVREQGSRLQYGLVEESIELRALLVAPDAQPHRYRAVVRENDARLATVARIAGGSSDEVSAASLMLRNAFAEWRRSSAAALARPADAKPQELDAQFGSANRHLAHMLSEMAAAGRVHRENIRESEGIGLAVNASLIIVAIAAVLSVASLSRRERELANILKHRVSEEAALRQLARDRQVALERVLDGHSHLMRGFSHDIKNPLSAADGYAELLTIGVYGELNSQQNESLNRVRRSIRSALALIDDLHEMARAETGNVVVALESVDIQGVARSSAEDYAGAAATKGLAIHTQLSPGTLRIETDPVRVRQIVSNLISNAIKYTQRGTITISTDRQSVSSGTVSAEWAIVSVRDTGIGIPLHKQAVIFDEFVRLGVEEGGAGLGLAVSQRIAQALGGRINVVSDSGAGSSFSLWLPVRTMHEEAPTRPATLAPAPDRVPGGLLVSSGPVAEWCQS